ncbi:hypothetical protein [Richelia sinica]|nr:hypothetical protein [Richelia sinica]MBD2665687.1 hypothetical protein [Richelia sinica FACHB-800]
MKIQFIGTTLAVLAIISGLDTRVAAESQAPKAQGENVTLSGASLVNISDRTAQDDFPTFFEGQNPGNRPNTAANSGSSQSSTLQDSLSLSSTPIFIQPANQNLNGNDGLQVQLDLTSNQ